jgi:hypothetical protein
LEFLNAGLLEPERIKAQVAPLVTALRDSRAKLMPRQKAEGVAWQFEDDYAPLRADAGLLLDILGHLPEERARAELRTSLALRDPRLLHFAALSLLRQGEDVPSTVWETVAASAEMRSNLWDRLAKAGRTELFPEKYRTQAAFAESVMVRWLAFPTELGRPPDEIELMEMVPVDSGGLDGVLESYVFRFRVAPPDPWSEKGWMAGVAGPFRRKDAPSTDALGGTFSTFEPWEGKSAREHLASIREVLENASARRSAD